jgi:micrococcal nuclease
VRVVDGDTVVLDGEERVRLIGVDTPETVDPRRPVQAFGQEASAFTKRHILGRRVRLERGWERSDRYGRTLAYVVRDDGWSLNEALLREGYAHALTRFPHPRLDAYRQLERDARTARRGLWADSP